MTDTAGPGEPPPSQFQPPYPQQPHPVQAYPAQPYPAQPYAAAPGSWQQQPAAYPVPFPGPGAWPPQRRSRLPWIIALAVVLPILLVGGFCFWGVVKIGQSASRASAGRLVPPAGSTSPSAAEEAEEEEEEEPAPSGPRASTYPVREDDDLNRVCDGWYYPQSPKVAGKAPHPITVGVIDTVVTKNRITQSSISVPDLRESIWRAWLTDNPAKTRLMGCVDLERTGNKLKTCKFDDPKPESIPMRQAFYRVRLYEVATGRKLLDKKATGEDEKCPSFVFLVGDQTVYSEVGDRQLYEMFRPFVMKKAPK